MDCTIRTNYAGLRELGLHEPGAECWLSPAERRLYESLRAPKRRATWLAGRIVAKRLLMEFWDAFPISTSTEIRIETRSPDSTHGQRPVVFVSERRLFCALSIAHTDRGVLVALTNEPGVTLGVDLVSQEDDGLARRLAWIFTPAERRWMAAAPDRAAGQLWANKEALYKACHDGEGFAPAQIDIAPDAEPCYPGLSPRRGVRSLQTWRVDGHYAALAVVET